MIVEQRSKVDKIAILIDYENIQLGTIRTLFKTLSNFGDIVLKRVYADWSKANSSKEQVLALGIEPIQVFRSSSKKKNACDIRLAIDAIELSLTTSITAFVIVSSDSDFVPLANKLRSSGKKVYCAGDKEKTLDYLQIACDEYFDLKPCSNDQSNKNEQEKVLNGSIGEIVDKNKSDQGGNPQIEDHLAQLIDTAWSKRDAEANGKAFPGPIAVEELLKVLKIENLKKSPYKNLKGVLNSNPLLSHNWTHNKNRMTRNKIS